MTSTAAADRIGGVEQQQEHAQPSARTLVRVPSAAQAPRRASRRTAGLFVLMVAVLQTVWFAGLAYGAWLIVF